MKTKVKVIYIFFAFCLALTSCKKSADFVPEEIIEKTFYVKGHLDTIPFNYAVGDSSTRGQSPTAFRMVKLFSFSGYYDVKTSLIGEAYLAPPTTDSLITPLDQFRVNVMFFSSQLDSTGNVTKPYVFNNPTYHNNNISLRFVQNGIIYTSEDTENTNATYKILSTEGTHHGQKVHIEFACYVREANTDDKKIHTLIGEGVFLFE